MREGVRTALRALRGMPEEVGAGWRITQQGRDRVKVKLDDAVTEALGATLDDARCKTLVELWFQRAYDA